jgi:general secretion pathway protein A
VDAIFTHTGGIPRRINTLCNRLLLFGYLDDLHHFSSVEVNKVAADLATEMSTDSTNGVAKVPTNGANGAVAHSEPEAGDRLGRLEQRVARQEEFMKRAAWIVRDLLAFQHTDGE